MSEITTHYLPKFSIYFRHVRVRRGLSIFSTVERFEPPSLNLGEIFRQFFSFSEFSSGTPRYIYISEYIITNLGIVPNHRGHVLSGWVEKSWDILSFVIRMCKYIEMYIRFHLTSYRVRRGVWTIHCENLAKLRLKSRGKKGKSKVQRPGHELTCL